MNEVTPIIEDYFEGLDSAEFEIISLDYPKAILRAEIITYREDFFIDVTTDISFKIDVLHNLTAEEANVWEMDITFTDYFSSEIIPLYWEQNYA